VWLSAAQEHAADCGILPWDFWAMTPAELAERVAAVHRADQAEWERTAWMVSRLMATWIGRSAPSVDELLGRVTDA
jgi:hypothetical protein